MRANLNARISNTTHLGRGVAWIDTLDLYTEKVEATNANRTQMQSTESERNFSEVAQDPEGKEVVWLPPRDSNPDMLIQSQLSYH